MTAEASDKQGSQVWAAGAPRILLSTLCFSAGFLLLFVVVLFRTVSWTSKGEVGTQLQLQGSLEGHPLI